MPLPTYKGYTVDYRCRQFRRITKGGLIEFIDFFSDKGDRLLARMIVEKKADWRLLHL